VHIQFRKVRYKNILSVGNHFIEIPLERHNTTIISGSNGSGKCVRGSTEIDIIFDDPEIEKKFLETVKK
jgi:predicted ATP-binding protein involved in virulence